MAAPWMFEGLIGLPSGMAAIGIIVVFVSGLMEARQGYIGRIGIFANSMLLWQIFFHEWAHLAPLMHLYLNLGTVFGVVALGSYLAKAPLSSPFYSAAFLLYGSLALIAVLAWWFF